MIGFYPIVAFAFALSGCSLTVYQDGKALGENDPAATDKTTDAGDSEPSPTPSETPSPTLPPGTGTPTSISFTTQPAGVAVVAGNAFSTPPIVRVVDPYASPVAGSTVALTIYSDINCSVPAVGTLNQATVTTAADGTATFSATNFTKVGTYYFKASVGAVDSDCSTGSVTQVAGAAAAIAFTTQPGGAGITAGNSFTTQPVVLVKDANDNLVSGATVALSVFSNSGCTVALAGTFSNGSTVSSASGVATFASASFNKVGTLYFKASVGAVDSACSTGTVTQVAGAAASVAFTTEPAGTGITAGSSFTTQPVALVKDANDNLVSGATVALSVFSNAGCTVTPAGTLNNSSVTSNASGVGTFASANFTKVGTLYFKVSVGAVESACSTATVTQVAGAAASVAFTTQPGGTGITAGSNFTTQPVVEVKDANDNLVSGATVVLTAYSNGVCSAAFTGTLNNGSVATNASGISTFTAANFTKAGTVYLKASVGAVDSSCSSGTVTQVAGAAASVVFTTQPGGSSITAGSSFTTQPIAVVKDANDNVVSGATVALAAYTNSGCTVAATGTLNNGSVTSDASGVATFATANFTKVGTIYLKASVGAVESSCSTGTISQVAGAASTATFTTQPAGSVSTGSSFSTQPVVTLTDTNGNAIASTNVVLTPFTVSGCTGAGSGTLSNATVATDAAGVATFSTLSYSTAQTIYLKATAGAVTACSTGTVVVSAAVDLHLSSLGSTSIQSCAISSGALRCWGANTYGSVGDNTSVRRTAPIAVSGMSSGVTQVSAGYRHTCAVVGGAAKCWGYGSSGTIGINSTSHMLIPTQVSGLSAGVTQVSAGFFHTCAIVSGAAKCWGSNNLGYGAVGDGTSAQRRTPVDVVGLSANVSQIVTGGVHSCALIDGGGVNGGVQCWGNGQFGSIGDNSESIVRPSPVQVSGLTSGATSLAAGYYFSCAVVSGSARCWGDNYSGTLGDGTTVQKNIPITVSGLTSGVSRIVAGSDHACALVDGGVKCWGSNSYGQLGDGTSSNRYTPAFVSGLSSGVNELVGGYSHNCAQVGTGIQCWGRNSNGTLGDASTTNRLTPVSVSGY